MLAISLLPIHPASDLHTPCIHSFRSVLPRFDILNAVRFLADTFDLVNLDVLPLQ